MDSPLEESGFELVVPPWKCGRSETKLTIPAEDRSIAGRSRRIGTIEVCFGTVAGPP
jgi:hypothetical protein